jgi:hypothetical protein
MAAAKYGNGASGGPPRVRSRPMPERDQRLLLSAAFATSVLLLVATLAGHAELLPYAAPLFLLALPLIAGRYVGEEQLERMRCGLHGARRPRRVAAIPATGRRFPASVPRGGRLIAQSLAERGPPVPAPS